MTTETEINNPKTPKIVLKLDEDNSVKFKLSIQGTVSDPSLTQTNVRFVVSENKTGIAWLFPLTKGNEDNLFQTTIPQKLGNLFSENKDYTGRVEVIVGGRYFNPTTVNIVFERELKVEASPILSETQTENEDIFGVLKPKEVVHSEILREKKQTVPTSALFVTQESKPTVNTSPKKKILAAIVEEKLPVGNKKRERQKNKLKSLIAEAWDELD